jgi:hypothetical protein
VSDWGHGGPSRSGHSAEQTAAAISKARLLDKCSRNSPGAAGRTVPPAHDAPAQTRDYPRAPATQDAYPRAPISETAILAVSSSPAMKTCRGAQIGLAPEHSPRGPQGCSRARRIGVSRRFPLLNILPAALRDVHELEGSVSRAVWGFPLC